MKIMSTKVFREIKEQKFRSILIIGIVAVSLSLMISMRASYPMMMASYRENIRQQSVADGRFTFTSPILESNVSVIENDGSFYEKEDAQDKGSLLPGVFVIYIHQ